MIERVRRLSFSRLFAFDEQAFVDSSIRPTQILRIWSDDSLSHFTENTLLRGESYNTYHTHQLFVVLVINRHIENSSKSPNHDDNLQFVKKTADQESISKSRLIANKS